ncbi:MAG TPA: hypothetical protein VFU14_15410 [Acidimicrobiales bacterium]|nr:hypothetical protein [Acidimicrobiales bacterium]
MDPTEDPRHPANHGNRVVESTDAADVSRKRVTQAREVDDGGTPTTPTLPRPMATGMVKGAVIGAIVGALLLTPLAFADILELGLVAKLAVVWIAGAAAGAAMGAVFLAGARAEDANPENDEYVYADGTSGRREGPGGIH